MAQSLRLTFPQGIPSRHGETKKTPTPGSCMR